MQVPMTIFLDGVLCRGTSRGRTVAAAATRRCRQTACSAWCPARAGPHRSKASQAPCASWDLLSLRTLRPPTSLENVSVFPPPPAQIATHASCRGFAPHAPGSSCK